MASAGRILIIPKGDYSDQTTYTNLDLVFYNNTSWLCRKECKGVKPSSATSEYWFRFSAIALANNLTTNADGYALDAKQGVVIKTNLDNLSLAINGLSDDVSALAASIDTLLSQNVAAIYDASKTYAAGDYVVYNNKLYECKTDVTVPEEFDSSKWTETYIMTSIDARVDAVLDQILDTKLSGIKGMIANEYRNDITYDVGAIVSYNGNLYKCIEDVTLAEEFDSSKWEETTMSDNLGGDAAGITYDNAKSGLKSNNVQGAVDELSSSLSLDFTKASSDVQNLNTLLQKTLEKLFPLKSIINFIVSTASNWINVAGMNFNAYDGYVTFIRAKDYTDTNSGRWVYYRAYYSKKVDLGDDSILQIAGILSMASDSSTPNNQDSMRMVISISDDAENWIDIGTAMTHSAYSAGTFNSSTPFSQTFDLSAYAGTSKYIAVKLADGWGNRQLTAKFTQFSLS